MKLKKLTSLTIVFALVCTINTATFAVDKSVAFESPQDEGPTIVATIKNLKTGEIEFINEASVTTISSHYLTDAMGLKQKLCKPVVRHFSRLKAMKLRSSLLIPKVATKTQAE